jgi:yecA family protein
LLSPHRSTWRDRFILLALWAKHNCNKRGPQWQDFAIVSEAIDSAEDLHDIPIMRSIAYNTLDYYRAMSLQQEEPNSSPHLRAVPMHTENQGSAEGHTETEGEELFFQTHGFLSAICCDPKKPSPKHWLPYLVESLFLDFDIDEHSDIMDSFLDDVLTQYESITTDLEMSTFALPDDNTVSMLQCSYWSNGFMRGIDCTGGKKKWDKRWAKKEFEPLRAGLSLIDAASRQDPNASTLLVETPEFASHLVIGFYESLKKNR